MNDYIKREDARKAACELCEWYGLCRNGCEYRRHPIDDVPAADVVERKTCYDTEESRVFRCSECGYGVNDIFEDMNAPVHLFERFKYWRFCPCCGAQIKEADK